MLILSYVIYIRYARQDRRARGAAGGSGGLSHAISSYVIYIMRGKTGDLEALLADQVRSRIMCVCVMRRRQASWRLAGRPGKLFVVLLCVRFCAIRQAI
jgi:hypothetical protein